MPNPEAHLQRLLNALRDTVQVVGIHEHRGIQLEEGDTASFEAVMVWPDGKALEAKYGVAAEARAKY